MHHAAGWLLGLSLALASSPSWAQPVFANGFEAPCSPLDLDEDRLTGCQEASWQTDPADADTDDDGISDGDEVLGTLAGLDLPAMGVDPRRKDILLEYDWFDDALEQDSTVDCPPGMHSHKPTPAALEIVSTMFAQAPVQNPDGSTGINVIHDHGQGGVFNGGTRVTDADGDGVVQGSVTEADYDEHYFLEFSPDRAGYFHHVLLPHRWMDPVTGRSDFSGVAELLASDFRDEMMVSLHCAKSDRNVGHTIAHELGHNLGLRHGGDSDCNRKPPYNSIMNYRYQFAGVDLDCDGKVYLGPADFSRGTRISLDEAKLDESIGHCGTGPFDWNGINGIESSVQRDINSYAEQIAQCGGIYTVLSDFDDWSAVDLRIAVTGGGGSPVEASVSCPGPTIP